MNSIPPYPIQQHQHTVVRVTAQTPLQMRTRRGVSTGLGKERCLLVPAGSGLAGTEGREAGRKERAVGASGAVLQQMYCSHGCERLCEKVRVFLLTVFSYPKATGQEQVLRCPNTRHVLRSRQPW